MMQSELLLPFDFDDEFFSWFSSPDEFLDHDNILIRDDDDFEKISRREMDEICDWINDNHSEGNSSSADEWSPSPSSESSKNTQTFTNMPINFPGEVENELSLLHLSRAYGEIMEGGKNGSSLAKVIVDSIKEKSSPQGNTMERVSYHMFMSKDDYLRQESSKNFITAFNVAYETLICGRFAHNAANAAIIESLPDDATVIHVVDFDIGEGIQWAALIEALSRKQTPVRCFRLTAMKLDEDCNSYYWELEETKRRLQDHAREHGIRLEVEEKCVEDIADEMMRRRKMGRGKEWVVFNLMAALPHMARRRRRSRVVEFLKVAEELLGSYDGILTFGDGEAGNELSDCICNSFASYFGKLLMQYQAVFESLERNFPIYLTEARTALECAFLAPFVCPTEWFEEWNEMSIGHRFETGLEGRKVSLDSLCEARVMVNERENWYNVKIEGLRENEMVLRWKETMIGRFSVFCSRR